MIKNINTILDWFKAGKKPTEQQFADSWQSFWHKEEIIPQATVENLETDLDLKADQADLEAHINDPDAHGGGSGAYVPYTGATGHVDLGADHRLGAGYVGGGYGDGTSVPASLAARNAVIPAAGLTSTVFGVYNSTGVRGFYSYADENDMQYINNRGAGGVSTNTAMGNYALSKNTTGQSNVAIGSYSLQNNTTGLVNTALGTYTLQQNTTGHRNTAFGSQAMYINTTGAFNSAFGVQTLIALTTGDRNTVIGQGAGTSITTGRKNTLIGRMAGGNPDDATRPANPGITTGQLNVIVAPGTDSVSQTVGITTGSNNTLLGGVWGLSANDSNWVVLADGAGNRAFEKNGATGSVNIVGSSLSFNGSSISNLLSLKPYAAKTADYTLTATDETVDFTDKTTATATLLTAIGNAGKKITIKNSGTGVITLGTTLSQTIDGAATFTIRSQYGTLTVQSDGANWKIISVYGL